MCHDYSTGDSSNTAAEPVAGPESPIWSEASRKLIGDDLVSWVGSGAEGARMGTLVITSVRLKLVLQTPDEVLAFIEAMSPADRAEVSPDWLARARTTPVGDPWALGFSVVARDGGGVVGSCGFKGPPDADGMVELAYGIDPTHRGRGYAAEAASALAKFAFADGRVRVVRAHTKPGNGASARVLAKCGFRRIGEVVDPEDGLVCRWERGQAEPSAAADGGA